MFKSFLNNPKSNENKLGKRHEGIRVCQVQDAEIKQIYAHLQESLSQVKQYIAIYQKCLQDTSATAQRPLSSPHGSLEIDAFYKEVKKLSTFIMERPKAFNFAAGSDMDYELFMAERMVSHQEIMIQFECFFITYERFRQDMKQRLESNRTTLQ